MPESPTSRATTPETTNNEITGSEAGAMPYDELEEAEQVEVLRRVAVAAAAAFGLEESRTELVLHSYNTTFGVQSADGGRWALRVGTNSKSTEPMIRAHQAWQHALREQTEVRVPEPLRSPTGDYVQTVDCPAMGRSLLVVGASWLAGPDLRDLTPEQALQLGQVMAAMHEHAMTWEPPDGAHLPLFADPLCTDEDLISEHEWLAPADAAVIARAMERTQAAYDRVLADQPVIALHADLHGGNLKASQPLTGEPRIAVFDFDDSGRSAPVLDIAISLFYLRDGKGPERERALLEGYGQVRELPDLTLLEDLVAARQLLLGNSMLASSTANWRDRSRDFLATSVTRLQHWLDTDTFSRV